MKIVLVHPQIPHNAGSIARTCAATGASLTLVRPLGFSLSDRHMKRAGLDYWERLRVEVAESVEEWLRCETGPLFLFSSKARYSYTKARYPRNAVLVFGSETTGLPEMLWQQFPSQFYRIPMLPHERCLNLAVSTGIALYEALRQNEFPNTF